MAGGGCGGGQWSINRESLMVRKANYWQLTYEMVEDSFVGGALIYSNTTPGNAQVELGSVHLIYWQP